MFVFPLCYYVFLFPPNCLSLYSAATLFRWSPLPFLSLCTPCCYLLPLLLIPFVFPAHTLSFHSTIHVYLLFPAASWSDSQLFLVFVFPTATVFLFTSVLLSLCIPYCFQCLFCSQLPFSLVLFLALPFCSPILFFIFIVPCYCSVFLFISTLLSLRMPCYCCFVIPSTTFSLHIPCWVSSILSFILSLLSAVVLSIFPFLFIVFPFTPLP